jgi:hypothetical protein
LQFATLTDTRAVLKQSHRLPALTRSAYRERNLVERFFNISGTFAPLQLVTTSSPEIFSPAPI